ncbi:MAG TPA: thioredoxin [bacterium]|nr:thioredoxin [bacterium]
MSYVTLTDANFDEEVLKAKEPVLVDFWAPWCGPCRMVGPVIEKLAAEFTGKVKIGKLNVDENQATAQKYGIMSIPTMKFFKNGEVAEEMIGAQPENILRDKLNSYAPTA